jgi:Macrocin-O-methyltransferase (TylF)
VNLLSYYKTLLWSRTIGRPRGHVKDWPYYRSIQLAISGIQGKGVRFPKSDTYTLLEFGVAGGASFKKMLHFRDVLVRRCKIKQRILCVGFDTFAGLPAKRPEDKAAPWIERDFACTVEVVRSGLKGYSDFELVEGLYSDTLPAWKDKLEMAPPLFVSVDCDYYSSTMDMFEVVLPVAPTGCMFYFDDVSILFWSDQAGELQAVREVNEGRFGKYISLSEYPLWIETGGIRHYKQLFRLVNLEKRGFTIARTPTEAEAATLEPASTLRMTGKL